MTRIANFSGFMQVFYSDDTLARDFEFIFKGKDSNDAEFYVVMHKDKSIAVIGKPSIRKMDGKSGMEIIGTAEFKDAPDVSSSKLIVFSHNVLQIDSVEVAKKFKARGYGFYLYFALASAGYSIISNSTQYRGGKELWKKIARQMVNNLYNVFIIQDGEVLLSDSGDPVVYDGANIDDAELWSADADKHYTLFALKRK